MTAVTSASASAGAIDSPRPRRLRGPDPRSPHDVAAALSGPMKRALRRAQEDLFSDRATVIGHGMTLKALRVRAIVTASRPPILTRFGRAVIATGRCGDEAT